MCLRDFFGWQQGDATHVPRSCLAARRYSQGLDMPLLPVHLPVTQLVLPNLKTTHGKLRRTCILIWGFSKNELKRNSEGLGNGRKNQTSCWLRFSTVVILGWCLNGTAEPRMPSDTCWQQCYSSRAKEQLFPALPRPGRHFSFLCAETTQVGG